MIEREVRELGQGELARVAPEVRRFIANRGEEDVVLIALGGANEHVGRDGEAFEDWNQERAGRRRGAAAARRAMIERVGAFREGECGGARRRRAGSLRRQ